MQRRVVVLRHWLGLSVAETAPDLASRGHREDLSSRGLAALAAPWSPALAGARSTQGWVAAPSPVGRVARGDRPTSAEW